MARYCYNLVLKGSLLVWHISTGQLNSRAIGCCACMDSVNVLLCVVPMFPTDGTCVFRELVVEPSAHPQGRSLSKEEAMLLHGR